MLHYLGQYDDADAGFERAIHDSDIQGLAKVSADSRYIQALMLAESGRLDQAAIVAADAVSRHLVIGDQASMNDAKRLLADIHTSAGEP